jgi:2Fe-2S iron-sulfur cluster binding domain
MIRPTARMIEVAVNGKTIAASAPDRKLLCDFLREDLSLTGAHVGCEHGVCGACTVLVDCRPVRSCLMLAVQAGGQTITTIEGVSGPNGSLHPVCSAPSTCSTRCSSARHPAGGEALMAAEAEAGHVRQSSSAWGAMGTRMADRADSAVAAVLTPQSSCERPRAMLSAAPTPRQGLSLSPPAPERWQSGRSRRTRNAEYAQAYRGFESLPLRQYSYLSI